MRAVELRWARYRARLLDRLEGFWLRLTWRKPRRPDLIKFWITPGYVCSVYADEEREGVEILLACCYVPSSSIRAEAHHVWPEGM